MAVANAWQVRLKLDQYGRAEAALVDAVGLLSAAHGSEHLSVAKAQTTLGELRLKQARFDEAEALLLALVCVFVGGLVIWDDSRPDDPEHPRAQTLL